jgi:Caspase domain
MPENVNESEGQRGLQAALSISEAAKVNRWAIVIGVSEYQYNSLNLEYAERDAEEFYQLLISPIGGSFPPENIVKLTNQDATTQKVTRALRSFLQKPGRDDLVIFYCACHGAPDFNRPENIYLITYDTDPSDIAGTALPMREINLSLRDNLLSKKVVLLADTCHSAAIGEGLGSRNISNDNILVNRYLQEVSTTRGGIALLTSAEANEVSFEDAKWGGGHGVFTHYLLQGMKGAADLNQDGIVTVGELFEYVRSNVQAATEGRQHPSIGTSPYDRDLPLAIFPPILNTSSENSGNLKPKYQETNYLSQTKLNELIKKKVTNAILWGTCVGISITGYIMYEVNKLKLSSPIPSVSASPKSVEPKPSQLPILTKVGLEIHYFPQGDKSIVQEALAPFGSRVKVLNSSLPPELPTNAIWFGSQVPIEDVRIVAAQLRRANVLIQSIQPFKDLESKQSVIDIGADRTVPKNQPVLTLDEIRNGVFQRKSNSS